MSFALEGNSGGVGRTTSPIFRGASSPAPGRPMEEGTSLQALQQLIQSFASEVSQLNSMITLIGSQRDSREARDRINGLAKSATVKVNGVSEMIKRISSAPKPGSEIAKKRLIESFVQQAALFKKISQVIREKEKTPLISAVPSGAAPGANGGNAIMNSTDDGGAGERQSLMEAERREQMKQIEAEREYVDGQNLEREEDVSQLEKNVTQVNEMFKDLATIVQEQGVFIDTIESNIEVGASRVEQGNTELKKAVKYERSTRSKMCWIALFAVIALLVVAVIIVVPAVIFRNKL